MTRGIIYVLTNPAMPDMVKIGKTTNLNVCQDDAPRSIDASSNDLSNLLKIANIINKPKGMVVHPGAGNNKNTLANALNYKYKNQLNYYQII